MPANIHVLVSICALTHTTLLQEGMEETLQKFTLPPKTRSSADSRPPSGQQRPASPLSESPLVPEFPPLAATGASSGKAGRAASAAGSAWRPPGHYGEEEENAPEMSDSPLQLDVDGE